MNKAKILHEANFFMYGNGHFDLYEGEVNKILQILDGKEPKQNLKNYYEELSRQRMG